MYWWSLYFREIIIKKNEIIILIIHFNLGNTMSNCIFAPPK